VEAVFVPAISVNGGARSPERMALAVEDGIGVATAPGLLGRVPAGREPLSPTAGGAITRILHLMTWIPPQ